MGASHSEVKCLTSPGSHFLFSEQVIQLVGHVMSPHDLSQFPDSKIFQIKKTVQTADKNHEIVNPSRSSPPALHSEPLR